ncbi:hypothetical protein COLO4_25371 [Corchorus olitorius]|uniref:Uncharacterized protein n=1 Tax=Corchorus olitorius TaxID=93759 RepID=A0A1R3I3B2_9ROSI|nr:hypothetical protein COLO4_25371 [Corchorus olitorius]
MEDDSIFLIKNSCSFLGRQSTSASVPLSTKGFSFSPPVAGNCSYKDTLTLGALSSYINSAPSVSSDNPPSATTVLDGEDDETINFVLSNTDKERLSKRWAQSLIVKSKRGKKMTQGGNQISNSLQNPTKFFESDKSVNASGKEQVKLKTTPSVKTSWLPKTFEVGQSSTLAENQKLEIDIPFSSFGENPNLSTELNSASFFIQEFESLSNSAISSSLNMGENTFTSSIHLSSVPKPCFGKSCDNAEPNLSTEEPIQAEAKKLHHKKKISGAESQPEQPIERPFSATIGLEGIARLPSSVEAEIVIGELIKSAIRVRCTETNSTRSDLGTDGGRGIGECNPSSHHSSDLSYGLGIENDKGLGKLVARPQLGGAGLDADNGTVSSPCGSPRVPNGQQHALSLSDRDQPQCKSFPRLRKILENARGTREKDAQDRIILPADTSTSCPGVATKARPKGVKNTRKSKAKSTKNVNDSMEL